MKILLINPPSTIEEKKKAGIGPNLMQKYLGFYPPLGLIHLSAYLEREGHVVDVLDAAALKMGMDTIADKVRNGSYDIVGMSLTTTYWKSGRAIAARLKKDFPEIPLVLGGGHARFFPALSLEYSDFDYAVFGEGELSFTELLEAIGKNNSMRGVGGIAFRENGKVIRNEPREWIKDMDSLPFASWGKLPLEKYNARLTGGKKNVICMMTARGCPYQCTFCSDVGRLGRKFRPQSAKRVFREIKHVYDNHHVRYIAFYDDTFTADMKRIGELCEMIIESGIDLKWDCRTRVDRVDRSLIFKMKRAGCECIKFGIESGVERIRNDILNKGISNEQIVNAVKWCNEARIVFHAYFMLGSPTETPETVRETIKFAIKMNPSMAFFQNVFLQDPNCPMFKWASENGYIKPDFVTDYIRGKSDLFYKLLVTEKISFEEHKRLSREATRSFYFRPRFFLKRLAKINSFNMLKDHILMALALVLYKLEKTD